MSVMDRDVPRRRKARRLRTGQHVHHVTLRMDAKLFARLEEVARRTGFARGAVARAAVEQGLEAVEAALTGTQKGKGR